ncbi:MAG: cell division ATP-binding protein FtsE [Clostridia bacterium]|nr:cell division ATP-binding protein FtsE [Clostridia bacterium]
MVHMYGVTKVYPGNVRALAGVDLSISKGDFVFIVGSSGAGKSTLLSMVYRGAVPTRGQVLVAGRNIARLRWHEIPMLRRKTGVVFQDFKLLLDRSVGDNVAFALQVIEAPPKDVARRVQTALEMVGLSHRASAMPNELSGGEQQRVAIARAIVNDPLILVADEPTGNLDPDTSMDIMGLLSDINRRGTTILMATHNQVIVDRMKRRVIQLDGGVIIRDEMRGSYCHEA